MAAFGGVSSRRTMNVRMAELIGILGATGAVGNVWFVDSVNGSSGNTGTMDRPVATIAQGIALATANNGDVIVCQPLHTEDLTGETYSITMSKAGVRVIGVGNGTNRPTITFSTALANILFNAANCVIENFLFKVVGADITAMMTIQNTDCTVKNCEFRAAAAHEPTICIDIGTGAAANGADRTVVDGCVFRSPNAGCTEAIELGEVNDGVVIKGCTVWGDFGSAPIHNPTGKVLTKLLIQDCFLENTQTGDHSIELVSACTGMLVRNYYKNDMTQQTGCDPGSCFSFECFHCDVVDTGAILCPVLT